MLDWKAMSRQTLMMPLQFLDNICINQKQVLTACCIQQNYQHWLTIGTGHCDTFDASASHMKTMSDIKFELTSRHFEKTA